MYLKDLTQDEYIKLRLEGKGEEIFKYYWSNYSDVPMETIEKSSKGLTKFTYVHKKCDEIFKTRFNYLLNGEWELVYKLDLEKIKEKENGKVK